MWLLYWLPFIEDLVIITVVVLDKTRYRALSFEEAFMSHVLFSKDKLKRRSRTFPTLAWLRVSCLATPAAERYTASDDTHTEGDGNEQP